MARGFVTLVSAAALAVAAGSPAPAQAESGRVDVPPASLDISRIRAKLEEEPGGWVEFFKQRTLLGVGFDEIFNNNVFLQDNDPQEDFISVLEAELFFADPRGSSLYGGSYEVNAFRHHRKGVNAIDHDFRLFFDFDPGGRTQLKSGYKLETTNQLLLGPEEIDILRRNAGFQRLVTHDWEGDLRYALNESNALVPHLKYNLYDDQAVSDQDSDRRRFDATVDLDHDLRRDWTLYGGYQFSTITIPGNELKGSQSSGARLGVRHAVSPIDALDLLLTFEHRRWRSDQQSNNFSFRGEWNHAWGPRTELTLSFKDERIPSFTSDRLQFRSQISTAELTYELSPLVKLRSGAAYERQRSGGEDVLTGNAASNTKSDRFNLKAGLLWEISEKGHVTLDYSTTRSKTGDYTGQLWALGFETEL